MKIPDDIQNRLTWSKRNDENWDRIEAVKPVNPCACGIVPQVEPVHKISQNTNPIPHTRIHCNYCKRYSIRGETLWFDTPHDLNSYLRLKENRQNCASLGSKD